MFDSLPFIFNEVRRRYNSEPGMINKSDFWAGARGRIETSIQQGLGMNLQLSRQQWFVVLAFFIGQAVCGGPCAIGQTTTANQQSSDLEVEEQEVEEQEDLESVQLDGMKLPLVFSEDFEQGAERWTTTDDSAWDIKETAAAGQQADQLNHVFGLNKRTSDYQPKHRSPHNIALIDDIKVADFVLIFDVKSTKDTGAHRDCCIFFAHPGCNQFLLRAPRSPTRSE